MRRRPWRVLLLVLAGGLGGCPDSPPKDSGGAADSGEPNEPPALTIDAPVDGDVTYAGSPVEVTGFVVDDVDAPADLLVTVTDSLDGALPSVVPGADGLFGFAITPSVGEHTLTFVATDLDGASVTVQVDWTVLAEENPDDEAPTTPMVHIDPPAPVTGDALAVAFDIEAVDPEGVQLTYTMRWTVDGADAGEGDAIEAGRVRRGETWAVEVVASDGVNESDAATASVVVGNAPPTASRPTLTPAGATVLDALGCSIADVADADADPVEIAYAWTVDGVEVAQDATLAAGTASADDEVICIVTLSDGYDTAIYTSLPLGVTNSPPGTPEISLTPASPADTDDLDCAVTLDATDPDGDAVTYSWGWTVDGVASAETGATVSADATHRDEVWTCSVTAADIDGAEGPPATASVTVGLAWADDVGAATADGTVDHVDAGAAFGKTVALVGDLDGDGTSELLVGADDAYANNGAMYLLSGGSLTGSVTTAVATASWVGTRTGGQLGGFRGVAAPGDLDADGVPELLFAAGNADANGTGSGEAYLLYGGAAWGLDADPQDADVTFVGTAGDDLGARLTAGDIDGDGLVDVIVAAPTASETARSSGSVAVYLNGGARWTGALTLGDADHLVSGDAENDQLGWTAKMVGDTDGDGIDDLFAAAIYDDQNGADSGTGGLVPGGSLSSASTAFSSACATLFYGDAAGDRLGYDAVGDVDLDGDGKMDLLVGAYRDDDGGTDAGSVQIFLGRAWATSFDVSDADARIVGDSASAYFGHVLATPGDMDGDGDGDVVIGALFDSPTGLTWQGSAWLFSGPDWAGASAPGDIAWHASGEAASDLFGDSLGMGRGDVDGDGRDDFVVGAQGHDAGGSGAGRVYLWRGR